MAQDFVYAFRSLRKSPGYAAVTILTLALGIGANTAIFSVTNGVLLKPLPYPNADRLVFITSQFPALGFDQFWVSAPEFIEFKQRNRSFQDVGAYRAGAVNLGTSDQPRRVNSAVVTSELMPVLGVAPLRGRQFTREDTLPAAEDVGILSAEVWQSAFGRDESVVGRVIPIDGTPTRIVGVMPPGFDVHDEKIQIWLPLTLDPANPGGRGSHFLYLVGRLRDGISIGQARIDVETMLQQWPKLNPDTHVPNEKQHRIRLDGLQEDMVGGVSLVLWVLQGAVAFVLLIACANLANLLLARAESRHKEFAVRAALGAGRARLLRQFIVEGCVLSCTGAALGLAVAVAGVRALIAAYPDSLPRSAEVTLDLGVLAFTLIVGLATGAIFGLAPLLHLGADATSAALKEGGTRSTAGAGRNRVRRALVAAEVALAVALVIGAGLLLRTVMNLSSVDSGFNRSRLVTFAVTLPNAKYAKPEQVRAFYGRLLDDLRSVGGVQSVAAMSGLPPLRQVNANDTDIENYTPPPKGPFANVDYYNTVTAGYVEAMGIPVVEGRAFLATDALGTTVMINETMARTFYKGTSAIGRRVRPSAPASFKVPWFTIVGVLKDVKQGGVDKKTGTELYLNFDQITTVNTGYGVGTMNIVMRTSQAPDTLAPSIRAIVGGLDPTLPIVKLRSVDDVFAESIGRQRLLAQLLGIFAALALLLAAIGSYGVLSYMVTERRREIGIRMALGADRASVLRMVLGQGLRLTLFGVLAGLTAAFALNRMIASLLFGVKPTDPATIGGVVLLITTVAVIACYLPARGATRVDPMIVLREE